MTFRGTRCPKNRLSGILAATFSRECTLAVVLESAVYKRYFNLEDHEIAWVLDFI